jgi:hypothetical protein
MQRYAYFTRTNLEHKWNGAGVSFNFPKQNVVDVKSSKFPLSELKKCIANMRKMLSLSKEKNGNLTLFLQEFGWDQPKVHRIRNNLRSKSANWNLTVISVLQFLHLRFFSI